MLTTVPFSGFYESLHDSQIDDCLERMFADDRGDAEVGGSVTRRAEPLREVAFR